MKTTRANEVICAGYMARNCDTILIGIRASDESPDRPADALQPLTSPPPNDVNILRSPSLNDVNIRIARSLKRSPASRKKKMILMKRVLDLKDELDRESRDYFSAIGISPNSYAGSDNYGSRDY
ncbi:hypothetical protein HELRODRAFT_169041 [Helobdella robusta]|uniref:Uncharacterized protein n=1 Tax=Helobdella robusta TaxID=6412 RepID=T1F1A8_HELRO|nr:hypothetical protein HELRODRAFT_169041 [Helobdella robusta]ESO09101.1 hypothetical protein HELRODRAFT_169041 [Helobdella robusta]